MARALVAAAAAVITVGAMETSCFASSGRSAATRGVLYTSHAPGGTEDLRVLDPASGTSTLVVSGDSISSRSLGAWSPDSRRIAFIRELGVRDELYVLDSVGGAVRRVGIGLPRAVLFPDWSPNGKRLAVSAGENAEQPGIHFVDATSGEATVLRTDASAYRCPSWSPRGDRLVVAVYQGASSALVILDTLGVVRDTLVRADTAYLDCPQWSPRGTEILFTVFHGGGKSGWERPAFHSNLAVVGISDRRVQQLTRDAGLTNYGRWARDGEWIVFQSDRHAPPTRDPAQAGRMLQNLEIWTIRRDGTGLRRLTTNSYFDAHPSW